MDELGPMSMKATNPPAISSMCTIFAESEIISLLSSGTPSEDIAMGMGLSIAKRIIAMGKNRADPISDPHRLLRRSR